MAKKNSTKAAEEVVEQVEVQQEAVEQTVEERREEIKEIINEEKEFVEPETPIQEPSGITPEKALAETKTAVDELVVEPEITVSEEIQELKEGIEEIQQSKNELEKIIIAEPAKAEKVIKEEIKKATELKKKADKLVSKNTGSFSNYWNGINYGF